MEKDTDITVLVAEDDPTFASRIIGIIGDIAGLRVVGHASDGERAVDMIRSHSPAIALLDFQMPKLNGLEVLAEALGLDRPPRCVMLTGNDSPEFRRRCLDAGAYAFLSKSTEVEHLGDLLSRLIEELRGSLR